MGDLLAAGSLIVALASAAIGAVAPTPKPSDAPLQEIGHVRATTTLCKALLVDAIGAVSIETANDAKLDDAYATLARLDFDGNPLVKFRSTRAIEDRSVALRAAAVTGVGRMKHFRDAAQVATDDAQRKSLTDFADVLSGALYRQKILADDLGRFVTYLDAHDAIDNDTHDRLTFEAILAQSTPGGVASISDSSLAASTARDFGVAHAAPIRGATSGLANPLDAVPAPLSFVAKEGALELEKRARPIADDERKASALIDPAFAGC